MCLKFFRWIANSLYPDQKPHSVVSDLGLHCISGLSVPILRSLILVLIDPLLSLDSVCVIHVLVLKKISYYISGELDPERMGSGIQYGDASLRRLQKQQAASKKPPCPCS